MSKQPAGALPARVLLTGASRGIGRAIAEALLGRGVRLALVGRERGTLEAVLGGARGHAVLVADLQRLDAAEACVEQAASALGGLEAFVACAGVANHAQVGAIGRGALERQLAVNFSAPFMMAQRAADHIARAGGGSILLIASTLGLQPPAAGTSAYAASKAALISMARSFALELGPRGVRVNAIAPGVVDTEMARAPHAGAADKSVGARLEALRALHPLGRLGRPEDVAESALYLLAAPYVTGAVMVVDGGLLLGQGVS